MKTPLRTAYVFDGSGLGYRVTGTVTPPTPERRRGSPETWHEAIPAIVLIDTVVRIDEDDRVLGPTCHYPERACASALIEEDYRARCLESERYACIAEAYQADARADRVRARYGMD